MLIKSISTSVGDRYFNITFPNKDVIVLNGEYTAQIMLTFECLLANDYTGNYGASDGSHGYNYVPFDGVSELSFANGRIIGKNGAVEKDGQIPALHCIRCIGNALLRSFIIESDDFDVPFNKDVLTDKSFFSTQGANIRFMELVNRVIGEEVVTLTDKLNFKFEDTESCDAETKSFICMLIAECMQTPNLFKRVVILDWLDEAVSAVNIRLVEVLCNIARGDMIILGGSFKSYDFKQSISVSSLDC